MGELTVINVPQMSLPVNGFIFVFLSQAGIFMALEETQMRWSFQEVFLKFEQDFLPSY